MSCTNCNCNCESKKVNSTVITSCEGKHITELPNATTLLDNTILYIYNPSTGRSEQTNLRDLK